MQDGWELSQHTVADFSGARGVRSKGWDDWRWRFEMTWVKVVANYWQKSGKAATHAKLVRYDAMQPLRHGHNGHHRISYHPIIRSQGSAPATLMQSAPTRIQFRNIYGNLSI